MQSVPAAVGSVLLTRWVVTVLLPAQAGKFRLWLLSGGGTAPNAAAVDVEYGGACVYVSIVVQ